MEEMQGAGMSKVRAGARGEQEQGACRTNGERRGEGASRSMPAKH
jgi:hypothetical protein